MSLASPTATALLAYIALSLILALSIISWRAWLTLTGARRANSFTPSGEDIAPWFQRLCRAHANCYEHFPIFGGLLLFALATQTNHVTDPLASYWFFARFGQSLVHLLSSHVMAVNLRFSFFLAQILIAI